MRSVFRFAPSPNGYLHLGHAYSALLNETLAHRSGGRFLLRIEDIDTVRCRPDLIEATLDDLAWLGLSWETPVLRQSTRFAAYADTGLAPLLRHGLLYPCFCSRKDIAAPLDASAYAGLAIPRDPDGTPLYPGTCRALSPAERDRRIMAGAEHTLRLDMERAMAGITARLSWTEEEAGSVQADPRAWGDVVLRRRDTPTSYHLSVVVDDAFQGVTHVVRGRDLYEATAVHRLLQTLLGLPAPRYRHHDLIRDADGAKLAKSKASLPIRQLRAEGVTPAEIRTRLGF